MAYDSWLSEIKVIIFDMDGTLYQEDTYLERYIRYLLEGTGHEKEAEAAVRIGRAILSGKHPFGFGHFYHTHDDLALVMDGDGIVHSFTWEGDEVHEYAAADKSGFNPSSLLHIGDPWSVAALLRHKYQLPEEQLQAAFDRVRGEMLQPPYQFKVHCGLFVALEELTALDKRVLMTNTPLKSGTAFLDYMQIPHLFEEVFCGAEKPAGMERYIASLMEENYQPHEILSIGDNPWNDLHPVRKMGGRTCLISPYESRDPESWDLRLTTLDELEQLVRAIQTSQIRRRAADGPNRAEEHKQEV